MANEENQTPPDSVVVAAAEPPTPKKASRAKSVTAEKTRTGSSTVKPKTRGLSDQEKLEKIGQIEAQVADGATLKEAVKTAGISDQTYYQWKKATAQPVTQIPAAAVSVDDELAEFIQLEEENRRLRKLLSEKLRAENADLRKRLGIS
ncbi:transposase [Rhizobium leguminosarum]|uniref:transposase n=1 Tax=Rhizobium leguminosarum TaxID=384 RepID=UPI00143F446C|nr:transposase [Rhizobium leguminosarum]MBY5840939.1 transposase [Rhizobium leguminosarum]MBY5869213.1 transposase [Rhizobium leguminosarum]NKK77964.1 transposase [Rhizobium leguminosarum bv. viciae]NKL08835.1 transposase [Rhizobium leguminosarum bv. viciae]NKM08346.1 transposase [Rhizobium leguminosarum bv. viciae]